MTLPSNYNPGPARGSSVQKNGDNWTLMVVRDLRHSPEKVWEAITDPAHIREWAPFDTDQNLGTAGRHAKLSTVGAPTPQTSDTTVKRAEKPHLLEYSWGAQDLRWQLEATSTGTRLTLWHNIDKRYIAMGAAGWHICLDVLNSNLDGAPIGRTVGMEVMQFEGWQRLHAEYSKEFGVEMPKWGAS